jgi:hypothetical protein
VAAQTFGCRGHLRAGESGREPMRGQINVYCYAPPPTDSWGAACNQRDHLRDGGDQDADRLDHHLPQAQQTRLWTVGRLARRLRGVEKHGLGIRHCRLGRSHPYGANPIRAREALTLQQAAQIATVSETTTARWCKNLALVEKLAVVGAYPVSHFK